MTPKGPMIGLTALGIVFSAATVWAASGSAPSTRTLENLATFETAAGVPLDDADSGFDEPTRAGPSSNLVRRIQEALADLGYYLGTLDGRFGPQTEAAIKAYQKSADLPTDGEPSERLAKDLETGGQVSALLGRLEKSRVKSTDTAREALLSNPLTRNLVEGNITAQGVPHDSQACMKKPEPRCLLIEAADSARDIDKPEMRDWALGEILTAQARAGLAQDAALTTRRIHDPRLIMVALRDIAKARAEIGALEDAMAAVDIIPDPTQQVEAYVAIAEIQIQRFNGANAKDILMHIEPYLLRIASNLAQISYRSRIAVILHKAGHEDWAQQSIHAAENLMPALESQESRDKARRYIAAAYAENGYAQKALDMLKELKNGNDDVPVLVAAATGLAQSGEADAALVTADNIEAVRYRALVLARIAAFQAGGGLFDAAQETLKKAKTAAATIEFPFAKAYAFSRIALAFNDVSISIGGDNTLLNDALEAAHLIRDDRLKAHIFWTIADERRRGGDIDGATHTQEQAQKATDDILSPFSRVWMLCDIAEERARQREYDAAWSIFTVALDEAKTIKNAWGRARALGKTAGTMTYLADKAAETTQTR